MCAFCSCIKLPKQDYCSTLLTNHHYAPGTLWISSNHSDLNDEIRQINELTDFTRCGELLNTLNCVIRHPACSANTKKLVSICHSQQLTINFQIKLCLLHLEDSGVHSSDFPLVKNLLNSVDCVDPETYYNFPLQYVETNSTNCLMLSKFNTYLVHMYYRWLCSLLCTYT